jgi:hypothetical protein
MAAEGSGPAAGALLLFVYSLGVEMPFIVACLFTGWALRAVARIRRHLWVIQIVCGVALIVYGVLLTAALSTGSPVCPTGGCGKSRRPAELASGVWRPRAGRVSRTAVRGGP